MTDPSLEFDHYLAEKLHCTVEEMRERVSGAAYVRWAMYYARKAQRTQLAR